MISARKTAHIYSPDRNLCAYEEPSAPQKRQKKKKKNGTLVTTRKKKIVQHINATIVEQETNVCTHINAEEEGTRSRISSVYYRALLWEVFFGGGEWLPLLCLTLCRCAFPQMCVVTTAYRLPPVKWNTQRERERIGRKYWRGSAPILRMNMFRQFIKYTILYT